MFAARGNNPKSIEMSGGCDLCVTVECLTLEVETRKCARNVQIVRVPALERCRLSFPNFRSVWLRLMEPAALGTKFPTIRTWRQERPSNGQAFTLSDMYDSE